MLFYTYVLYLFLFLISIKKCKLIFLKFLNILDIIFILCECLIKDFPAVAMTSVSSALPLCYSLHGVLCQDLFPFFGRLQAGPISTGRCSLLLIPLHEQLIVRCCGGGSIRGGERKALVAVCWLATRTEHNILFTRFSAVLELTQKGALSCRESVQFSWEGGGDKCAIHGQEGPHTHCSALHVYSHLERKRKMF